MGNLKLRRIIRFTTRLGTLLGLANIPLIFIPRAHTASVTLGSTSLACFTAAATAHLTRRYISDRVILPPAEQRELDLADARISFTTRMDNEFYIHCTGGHGVLSHPELPFNVLVAATEGTGIDVTIKFPTTENRLIYTHPSYVEKTLISWQNNDTPVRMVRSRHGRAWWLLGDDNKQLTLPRMR